MRIKYLLTVGDRIRKDKVSGCDERRYQCKGLIAMLQHIVAKTEEVEMRRGTEMLMIGLLTLFVLQA